MTVFDKIIQKEIAADIVYEDEECMAFRDIHPQAPIHILIIPKEKIRSIRDVTVKNQAIIGKLMLVAKDIAKNEGIDEKGYRIVTNIGDQGGQSVDHLHFHLLGGRQMKWPPG